MLINYFYHIMADYQIHMQVYTRMLSVCDFAILLQPHIYIIFVYYNDTILKVGIEDV